jgi:PEP-CTERM motif
MPATPRAPRALGLAARTASELEAARNPLREVRPVYRHSVVAGGVRSAREVASVILRDRVVAAHYEGIDPAALREEQLPMTRLAYVSYRLDDRVYWTRKPVRVPAGEPVLTDGEKTIRARCGNLIAADPLGPAAENEPPLPDLELLVQPMTFAGEPLPDPLVDGAFAYDPPDDPSMLAPILPSPVLLIRSSAPPPPPAPKSLVAPVPVPEPGTWLLVGLGGGVGLIKIARSCQKTSRA